VKILATLTLTTLTVGMYAGTAAADQATCVVTAQPQNNTSYHLAYTDTEGLHTLIAHQDGRHMNPTSFEIPADFDQVLWATKQGRIDGPDSFYDRLSNGGGCTFTEPYHAQPGWRASVIIRPGHTPTTTSSTAPTTSTTAPTTTTSTTPPTTSSTAPEATTTTTSPAVTTWRTTPLPDQPPVAIPPGSDVAIDPPPTTAPTPYTAVPRLPDTGRNAGMVVGWGVSVLLSGAAFLAGGRACRNRKDLK
jgi:hypothetical protein